jgi:general secretion pathway protein A
MAHAGYETRFGLVERPFSLASEPKYFFKGHTHGRALESLTFALRRRDPFLLLTGDLGIGKTTVCRTLVEQLRRRGPVAYFSHPLRSGRELERVLLETFNAVAFDDVRDGAVIVIDEAQLMPTAVVDLLRRLSAAATARGKVMPVVFASQTTENNLITAALQALDPQIAMRARLLPFGREDCAAYVAHRLTIAGGGEIAFTSRATDVLFGLSGGVPRLVNLLCEHALQEAAAADSRKIEAVYVEGAASALELRRARPRRFRWFHKQVS